MTTVSIASIVGWLSEPHGYGLNDEPGIDDRVRLAEHGNEPIEIDAAAEHLEESPLTVEAVVAAGEAARGELGGDDAVFGRARRVQRLGHRSEVDADAARHARRDREHVAHLRPAACSSASRRPRRRRTCRSCRSSGSRGCSAAGSIASAILHSTSKPTRNASRNAAPERVLPFGDRQRGGERGHRRVRQQPERAIGRRRQLRVVVVHRVAARGVEQGGMRGRRHQAAGADAVASFFGRSTLARSRGRLTSPSRSIRRG